MLCCAAALLATAAGPSSAADPAGTRYVETTGNDADGANDCTDAASPCKTIGQAVAQADSGNTVYIGPGVYTENLTLTENITLERSPGASSRPTINGSGSDAITVDAGVSVTLRQLRVSDGRHGVNTAGSLTIDGGLYEFNNGSGVLATSGSVTVTNATVRGNLVGAGVHARGSATATVADSTFTENLSGVGAEETAKVQVLRSTFEDNTFGLVSTSSAVAVLSASTITGSNVGIWSSGDSADILTSGSTVSDNTTGVRNEATAYFAGSIVAGNGTDCAESGVIDGNFNLGGDGTCAFGNNNSLDNADPHLQANLTDNGGPTETLAPSSTSPAVDVIADNAAGTHAGLHLAMCNTVATSVDQRGEPRQVEKKCDIGSVELAESTTELTSSANPAASSPTLTATITGQDGLPTPQGRVAFEVAGSPTAGCDDVSVSGGTAACTLDGVTGSVDVTATYTGTNGYRTSSDTFTQTIGSAPEITSADAATFVAGQPVAFTVTADGSPQPSLSVGGRPDWLSFDATTGVLSGTPPPSAAGTVPLTVTATNDSGTDTQTLILTIEAATPDTFALAIDPQVLAPGEQATLTGSGLPAGTEVEFEGQSTPFPLGSTTVTSDGTFSHTFTLPSSVPAGLHQVVATARLSNDAVLTQTVAFTVLADGDGDDDDDDGDDDDGGDDDDDDGDGDDGDDGDDDDESGVLPDTGGPATAVPPLALLLVALGAVTVRLGRGAPARVSPPGFRRR